MTAREHEHVAGRFASWNGSMGAFLSEVQSDLQKGMLSARVFNDPDLHRAELDRIFTKCWVFVGHVSEIPTPGDYVLRYVGEDQFILVRDENGDIQLLFNACMHRGASVCRAEKGNTSHFRCPYHGWIYKNTGDWNGAPLRAKAYKKLDASQWGLRKAPHVDSYRGLIFACLDPGAVSLQEYLGDMCWYLDVIFGLSDQGMSVHGDPHRWVIPANWKSGADNFVGDAYHVAQLHGSLQEIGFVPDLPSGFENNFHITLANGHGILGARPFLPEPFKAYGYSPDIWETFDLEGLNDAQRQFLDARLGVTGFTIFPNLSFFRAPGTTGPHQMPVIATELRQWQPRGPESFELWNWPMVWNCAPEEYNQASYDAGVLSFSPSGMFEQDDTVPWSGGPATSNSAFARGDMKFNFQLGLDGMSDYDDWPNFPGPGEVSANAYGERNQRRWWQRWAEQLASS